jgi:ATP-dependent Clp protease ATP-binding subunit ClpA
MIDSFTEESVKVIMLAHDESRRIGHSFVCTGQILLGTISEGTSIAAEILKSKGVTLEQARIEVEKIIGRGSDFVTVDLPLSPKVCRALDLALEEVEQLKHNYLDAEHLLLGTLRIEDGVALQVLATLGVDASEIRDPIVRSLGDNFSQKARRARALALEASVASDLALEKAKQLEHNCLDAEHPLPDTLLTEDKTFLQVLANLGVDTTKIILVDKSTQR